MEKAILSLFLIKLGLRKFLAIENKDFVDFSSGNENKESLCYITVHKFHWLAGLSVRFLTKFKTSVHTQMQ